jgi:hypothetical protein
LFTLPSHVSGSAPRKILKNSSIWISLSCFRHVSVGGEIAKKAKCVLKPCRRKSFHE